MCPDDIREKVLSAIAMLSKDKTHEPMVRELLLAYITEENVDLVFSLLDEPLRGRFLAWAVDFVKFRGIPIGWKRPLPEEKRRAINEWILRHRNGVH